jgi:hypothetical protein
MCGIFGVISTKATQKDRQLFKTLLLLNTLRGEHGAGIVKLWSKTNQLNKTHYKFSKAANHPIDVLHEIETNNPQLFHTSNQNTRGWMGHCRHATVGAKKSQNCHPFKTGKILGMHNGTINGFYPHKADYDTDSEALFHTINKTNDFEKAIQDFHHTNGAWALSFVNTDKHTFHLFRNHQRPLAIAYTQDMKTLIYSSVDTFLELAAKTHQRPIEEIWMLKPNVLFTLNLDNNKYITAENTKITPIRPFTVITRGPITPKKSNTPPQITQDNTTKEYQEALARDSYGDYSVTANEHPYTKPEDTNLFVGPNNTMIDQEELKSFLKLGCANCETQVTLDDVLANSLDPAFTWLLELNGYVCWPCSLMADVQPLLPPHLRINPYGENDYEICQHGHNSQRHLI